MHPILDLFPSLSHFHIPCQGFLDHQSNYVHLNICLGTCSYWNWKLKYLSNCIQIKLNKKKKENIKKVSSSVKPNSVTPWTAARQAPLSMEFSRQEYWSGLAFPSPIKVKIKYVHTSLLSFYNIFYIFALTLSSWATHMVRPAVFNSILNYSHRRGWSKSAQWYSDWTNFLC